MFQSAATGEGGAVRTDTMARRRQTKPADNNSVLYTAESISKNIPGPGATKNRTERQKWVLKQSGEATTFEIARPRLEDLAARKRTALSACDTVTSGREREVRPIVTYYLGEYNEQWIGLRRGNIAVTVPKRRRNRCSSVRRRREECARGGDN